MLRLSLLCCTALLSTAVLAEPLSCDQLKADIEVKIQSAGVTAYALEAVPNAEVRDPNMVVGSCANGTYKILYQRNG